MSQIVYLEKEIKNIAEEFWRSILVRGKGNSSEKKFWKKFYYLRKWDSRRDDKDWIIWISGKVNISMWSDFVIE